jgi:hypothetical protein
MKKLRSPRVSAASQQSSGGAAAAEGDVESPAAGKAKRGSGLSAGGAADKGQEGEAVKQTDSPHTRQRKRRKLCCILMLLLALIAAGIGVGVWQGVEKSRPKSAVQQQQQPGAPLTFRVTVGAPTAEQSAVACAKWFGDKQVSSIWRLVLVYCHEFYTVLGGIDAVQQPGAGLLPALALRAS